MADRCSTNSGSSDSSGEEGEDSESSSSSSTSSLGGPRVDLSEFREHWQQEIKERAFAYKSNAPTCGRGRGFASQLAASCENTGEGLTLEASAKRLFRLGSREEANGNLYVAIEYYKRACQILPDVEMKIAEEQLTRRRKNSYRKRLDSGSSLDSNGSAGLPPESDISKRTLHFVEEAEEPGDREAGVEMGVLSLGWCEPEVPLSDQQTRHISDLPIEVLFYIFKWVVGANLDIATLSRLALVCRSFYSLARDEELWRLVCLRQWGANCGVRPSDLDFPSWRAMATFRPHVLFNGCYIGKVSYVRSGEPALGAVYRPYFIVEYFRCLRFLPDGSCFMMTSPEEPAAQVRALGARPPSKVAQGLMQGRYLQSGDLISAVLHWATPVASAGVGWRARKRQAIIQADHIDQSFQVCFVLKNSKKKLHNVLEWKSYAIIQKYKSGREVVSDFNIKSDAYPSLYFSRVKSYTAGVADEPLQ